jgi:caffeoyl-CoA O-methyltransferase
MSMMLPDLEGYFRQLTPAGDALLLELEQEAERERIPIVGPLVGTLLLILARATGARTILELGTATGYSAIHLARGCEPAGGKVLSLEYDPQMAARARVNLRRAGLATRVEVREGEALQLLAGMSDPVDFIFLDIDKESYLPALDHAQRLLRSGGLLVADNTGFAGAHPFNQALLARPEWRAAPLLCFLPRHSPERDGLTMAVKI